jgi:hypothetical protein
MMFGDPEARKAQRFDDARQSDGVVQRIAWRLT